MKKATLLAACLGLSALAQAEFKPSLSLDKRARYENQQVSARAGWGQSSDLVLVPAFAWGAHAIIPVFAEIEQGRVMEIEETYFVRRTSYLAKPLYRFQGDAWGFKLWGTAKRTLNQEKDDTVLYQGLYDWEEYGLGLGTSYKLGGFINSVSLGLEPHHRTYLNFHELGASLTNDKNYYTKDYNGLKLNLDLAGDPASTLGWSAGVLWLDKSYTDAYLLDETSDGVVLGTLNTSANPLRHDDLLRGSVGLVLGLSPKAQLGLDLGVDWNLSNMNFFDSAFNQGVGDLYSYVASSGALSFTLLPTGAEGPRFTLRASLLNRQYCGRPIRNLDGSYTEGKQADLEQDYSLNFEWPIQSGFSVVGGGNWTNVTSNQGFAAGVRPAYDLFSSTLGLKYKL